MFLFFVTVRELDVCFKITLTTSSVCIIHYGNIITNFERLACFKFVSLLIISYIIEIIFHNFFQFSLKDMGQFHKKLYCIIVLATESFTD